MSHVVHRRESGDSRSWGYHAGFCSAAGMCGCRAHQSDDPIVLTATRRRSGSPRRRLCRIRRRAWSRFRPWRGCIQAVEQAEPGQTILLADGHYLMPRYVEIRADRVTLRGASGHRERVILDGAQSRHGELLGIRACSGVTIADLTIQNIRYNGFKINSDANVQRLTIHNCIIHNIWQRGVKGVKVPEENREAVPAEGLPGPVLPVLQRPAEAVERRSGRHRQGNYVAGIDVMYAKDWVDQRQRVRRDSGQRPSRAAGPSSSGSIRRTACRAEHHHRLRRRAATRQSAPRGQRAVSTASAAWPATTSSRGPRRPAS